MVAFHHGLDLIHISPSREWVCMVWSKDELAAVSPYRCGLRNLDDVDRVRAGGRSALLGRCRFSTSVLTSVCGPFRGRAAETVLIDDYNPGTLAE